MAQTSKSIKGFVRGLSLYGSYLLRNAQRRSFGIRFSHQQFGDNAKDDRPRDNRENNSEYHNRGMPCPERLSEHIRETDDRKRKDVSEQYRDL